MEFFYKYMKKNRWLGVIIFFIIFLGLFLTFYILGWIPGDFKNDNVEVAPTQVEAIFPSHIKIPIIGVDTIVQNPTSRDVDTLDGYLTKGAVRYPGSGTLASGNMFIFGHSTGYSVVRNQAYKALNGLKDLKVGDSIEIKAESGKIYIYKVSSVKLVTAEEELVDFSKTDRKLTLTTCNSFGKKEERYVVEAYFDKEI
jgi:LPXTG-site transpeptidase (sortase) family protein